MNGFLIFIIIIIIVVVYLLSKSREVKEELISEKQGLLEEARESGGQDEVEAIEDEIEDIESMSDEEVLEKHLDRFDKF